MICLLLDIRLIYSFIYSYFTNLQIKFVKQYFAQNLLRKSTYHESMTLNERVKEMCNFFSSKSRLQEILSRIFSSEFSINAAFIS